ncbi:LONG-CHAIN-ALCOHOL O-FATTY-ACYLTRANSFERASE 3-RELATED [Salix koriyanagi]|uniref:LONG-CHAIN-ALCOHOL O-FATTY-ACYLTRANSFERASE 3-RELATED n=1 Tax=Salix koriyanagi TaxID=2511006 RepID=A0A9Q0VG87_9ROSI|nr:LONG-CHAIN-ALCOHOL O-FATTY-ACYLTRANSFERASE 3-RELATED [Salix koriyanagi]
MEDETKSLISLIALLLSSLGHIHDERPSKGPISPPHILPARHLSLVFHIKSFAIFPLKIQENTHPSSPIMVARYELVTLFNKPYLATSLQDFWGRRWNRLSSNILRQTIYDPTQNVLVGFVGAGKARVLAMVTTLVISGVMHELMF